MDAMHLGFDAKTGERVTFPARDLTTHGVVLGSTGSGKSGAVVTLVEEAVLSGASAIIVDPKGDLTNLALRFPFLTPEELTPWLPRDKGPLDPAAESARLKAELGDLLPNVQRWRDAADVAIYAPGKLQGGGLPVNLLPSFDPPGAGIDPKVVRERAATLVASVLGRVGHESEGSGDSAEVFLTDVVLDAWRRGKKVGLEEWAQALAQPPQNLQKIGGLGIEDFFPKKDRMKVARALVGFQKGAARWLEGEALSIDGCVGTAKPKVTIFTLRHLTDENDRQFFASLLFGAIRDYMFRAPASGSLKLLVVLDEADGYLPPAPKNPPTKKPLCTLLAQGRAQGIGLVIATQNPVNLDYKALSNVNTMLLGRLRERDCARDLETLLSSRQVDVSALLNIQPRHFVTLMREGTALTKIRCTYSYLRGPITGDELVKLDPPRVPKTPPVVRVQPVAPVAVPAAIPVAIPVAPAALPALPAPAPQPNPWRRDDIEVPFTLTNGMSLPANVRLVVTFDGGGSFFTASTRTPTQGLATSPEGTHHVAIWDSFKDTGERVVKAQLRVDVDGQRGTWEHVFHIDNRRSVRVAEKPSLLNRLIRRS